jgi:hypothetical protein
MSGDFKDPEMPPEPDAGHQPAGEPPAESHAGRPAGSDPAPRVEGQEAEEVGFKTAPPGSHQGTAGEPEADGHAGQPAPSRPEPQADSRRPVEGVFKTPHWVAGAIVENQKDAVWWAHRDDLEMLRTGGERLIHGLDLRVNDEGWDDEASGKPARGPWAKDRGSEKLGVPLIRIEKLNIRTLADYRPQADGYAIAGTIVINEERLRALDPVQKLVLILVMLVRVRQHLRGGDGRLDREGRALLKAKGVVVTEKGKITIAKDGAFRQLLEAEGFDLQLMDSVSTAGEIPAVGKDLVIVAKVGDGLHFRVFDGDGEVIVDAGESGLTAQAGRIANLKKQLKGFGLWPPHRLTGREKGQVIAAVSAIVGHDLPARIEAPVTSAFPQPEREGRSTLQIWSCSCGQKCRVGTRAFLAVCPECHEPFRPGDHRGQQFVPTGT